VVRCEIERLSPGQQCDHPAQYAITVSYLGRPALTVHLCGDHTLDMWNVAETTATSAYGDAGTVKRVAVKKLV
jgi:hypothetical protein